MADQAIGGKDLGDRLPREQADKVQAAQLSKLYQWKTFTLSGIANKLKMSGETPDAPNDASQLFSLFKRAHRVFIKSDQDITVQFNSNSNDEIPILTLEGGQFEEDGLEVEEIFLSGPDGAVVSFNIS